MEKYIIYMIISSNYNTYSELNSMYFLTCVYTQQTIWWRIEKIITIKLYQHIHIPMTYNIGHRHRQHERVQEFSSPQLILQVGGGGGVQ